MLSLKTIACQFVVVIQDLKILIVFSLFFMFVLFIVHIVGILIVLVTRQRIGALVGDS